MSKNLMERSNRKKEVKKYNLSFQDNEPICLLGVQNFQQDKISEKVDERVLKEIDFGEQAFHLSIGALKKMRRLGFIAEGENAKSLDQWHLVLCPECSSRYYLI